MKFNFEITEEVTLLVTEYFKAHRRGLDAPNRIVKQYKDAVRECRGIEKKLQAHVVHQAVEYVAKVTRLIFCPVMGADAVDSHALYTGEKDFKLYLYAHLDVDVREHVIVFDFYLSLPSSFGGPTAFVYGNQDAEELSQAIALKRTKYLEQWRQEREVLQEKLAFILTAENAPGMPKFKEYQRTGKLGHGHR